MRNLRFRCSGPRSGMEASWRRKGARALPVDSHSMRVFEKKKTVEPNALIFYCKTKVAQEAKHVDMDMEVFFWFKQQHGCVGLTRKVLPFAGKCSVWEQLLNHQKRTLLGQCMLVLTFLIWKTCEWVMHSLQNHEKRMNEVFLLFPEATSIKV